MQKFEVCHFVPASDTRALAQINELCIGSTKNVKNSYETFKAQFDIEIEEFN